MDCLEYRRRLATDPRHLDDRMRLHAARCPGCAAAAQQSAAGELALQEAFALDPHPSLTAHLAEIPATQPARLSRAASLGRRLALPVAATVLVATLAGGAFWSLHQPPAKHLDGLDAAVVKLIRDEVWTLASNGRIEAEELGGTLATIGLGLREPVAKVRFAANCIIRGKTAAHWVLEGERAPITVLVMPEETLPAPAVIAEGSLRGLLLPAGRGSIALVGAKGESLREVSERIRRAVDWSA